MNTPRSPVLVGITGGIACGKSEVGRILARLGVAVLDADDVAHEAIAPGGAAYEAVLDAFGDDIRNADGTIDRRRLGERVFADPEALRKLNERVHPPVIARCRAWARRKQAEGKPAAVIVPLLYEAGMTGGWTAVVCVAASPGTVRERLARRGWSDGDAERRLAAQWPLEEKLRRADHVIRNDGTREELEAATRAAWDLIRKQEKDNHG